MQKQVSKSHYQFSTYMRKSRWISIWHQLDEVVSLRPNSVLEVGPGSGIFKNAATAFGLNVKTLDLDPELNPDYIGSAAEIPLDDKSFDVVCAFQVLEHMPFEVSLKALVELCRVARKAVIISLPDVATSWASTLTIPKVGTFRFVLPRPLFRPQPHVFDGEHYWEISKLGYSIEHVVSEFRKATPGYEIRSYRVHENQYHRFFVFDRPEEASASSTGRTND